MRFSWAAPPPRFPDPGHASCRLRAQNRGASDPYPLVFPGELSPPLDSCRRDPFSLASAREEEARPPPRPLQHVANPSAPPRHQHNQSPPLLHHPRRSRSRSRRRVPGPRCLLVFLLCNPDLQHHYLSTLVAFSAFRIHHGPPPFRICEFSPFLIS
jgi:hypothetical protein